MEKRAMKNVKKRDVVVNYIMEETEGEFE